MLTKKTADAGKYSVNHSLLDRRGAARDTLACSLSADGSKSAGESWASQAKPLSRTAQSGSVLIAVLAIIVLLSLVITRFMEEALEDLEYRAIFNEPADVRSYAYSILELSLATIHEVALIDDGKLYAPEQGWGKPLEYANVEVPNGWEVSVDIKDEGGKLSLNTMDEEMLNKMLEETFEFDFGTARELSSMLLDWRDPDSSKRLNGAESEDYLRRNPPYRAANGPLQSLEELRLLEVWEDEFFDEEGQPNELFTQLSNMVSVYQSGAVNLNKASAEVLELLALQDGYDEDFIFDGLDKPYLTQLPGTANKSTSGVETGLFRVTVSLRRGNVPFTISALVELNSSTGPTSGGNAPGRRSDEDTLRTGTQEEQDAINYPFKIIQLSEYDAGESNTTSPARYSALDMSE